MTAPVVTAPTPVPAPAPVDQAGAIVTQGTGITAPVPAPAPTPRTREEVMNAIIDGTTPAVKRGHPEVPGDAVVETSVAPPALADASNSTESVSPAHDAPIAAPDGTQAPTQSDLERGQDVGTGDALFRVRDPATGQFLPVGSYVYELAIRNPETGEVGTYAKSPQELARMARDGIAGQRHFQRLQQIEREVIPQITRERDMIREQFEAQVALNREILGDEERYLARREQYLEDTGPDKRLARLEAQLNEERTNNQRAEQARQRTFEANRFYETRIQPVVSQAIATLSPELVLGRMNLDTAHLMVNGVVPPARWNELEAYVRGPFTDWVRKSQPAAAPQNGNGHASGSTATTAAKQKTDQRAVNQAARAMQPVGAAGTESAKPLPPPKNRQEALERILARPIGG